MDRAHLSDREVADRFIEVFYRQNRLVDAFREWVHPDYIQHDPNSASGRDGTIEALEAHMRRSPHMSHDIKRHAPDQRGLAVVDMFRIEDGWLVEHWDVIQPIPDPEACRNTNGMF